MKTKSGGAPKLRGCEDKEVHERRVRNSKEKSKPREVVFQRPNKEFKTGMMINYVTIAGGQVGRGLRTDHETWQHGSH